MSEIVAVRPLSSPPDTVVRVPGSKSLTNRALPAAALADGASIVRGIGVGDDVDAMLDGLRELGVHHEHLDTRDDELDLRVEGVGGVLPSAPATIYVRASGTTARFLTAIVAPSGEHVRIDGDPQLRARPIDDLVHALRSLGVEVTSESLVDATLPFTVFGTPRPGPQRVVVSGRSSSQFLSGLLLSGPCYPEGLTIEVTGDLVSRPYVSMTCAVMEAFGVTVEHEELARFVVPRGQRYQACDYSIEPDASSASYFFAAAALTGGRVRIDGLGLRSVQGDLAFVRVLERMGADVEIAETFVEVRGTGILRGIEVDLSDFSDCAPTLAVTAAFASTPTRVTGIGFIRQKESDRVVNVVRELRRCGVHAEEEEDGFLVHAGPRPVAARFDSYDDHRIAMAFALVGLIVDGVEIVDPQCVSKTFPGYWQALEQLR